MSWHRLLPLLLVATVACFDSGKDDDDDDDDDDDGDDTAAWADDSGWTGGDDTGGGEDGGGEDGGGEDGGGEEGGGEEGGGEEGGGEEGGGDGDPVGLCTTDHAWALDIYNATHVEPAGVGELVAAEFDNDLLLGFTETSSSGATLLVGTTDGAAQDTCVPTERLTGTWSNPGFSVGPDNLTLRAMDQDFGMEGVTISGTVTADCESLADVTLEGRVDAREMVDATEDLLGISDADELCATFTGFGVSCVPCSDGQTYCLDVRIEDITGTGINDPIVQRTESQILSSATCDGVGQGCESAPVPERRLPLLPLALLPGVALLVFRRR